MTDLVANDNPQSTGIKNLVKNATDLQRLKLERLMKNPVSLIYITKFISLILK